MLLQAMRLMARQMQAVRVSDVIKSSEIVDGVGRGDLEDALVERWSFTR